MIDEIKLLNTVISELNETKIISNLDGNWRECYKGILYDELYSNLDYYLDNKSLLNDEITINELLLRMENVIENYVNNL